MAYTKVLSGSGFKYWENSTNVWVKNLSSGEEVNVTRLNVRDDNPAWSADGKFLYFTSDRLARAQQLFDQLQCAKCHQAEGRPPPDPQAPSLDIAKHRLQPEWVEMWLREPQMISPGTAMPSFGLADEDNRLLADYLRILGDRYQAKGGEYEFTVDRTQAGDE